MQASDFVSTPGHWLWVNAPALLSAIAVLALGWYVSRIAAAAVRRLLPRAHGVDRNFAPLLSQVARYGIMVFAIVTALNLLGVASASIYAVLGAAGLAIALALQGTLANIASGIMLVWLRPIAIGEYITSGAIRGVVVEIGLFGTRLRSSDGLYIFAPNQIIWSSAITNHSREPRRRIDINVTFPDSIDLPRAQAILLRSASADQRVLGDPAPNVHVESFSGASTALQLRCWVTTSDYLPALYALSESAKLALDRELKASTAEKAQIGVTPSPDAPGRDS